MGRLISTSNLSDVVMKRKAEYGKLATLIENIVGKMVIETPTADAIPIPKEATNGDMIKVMFPNELLTSITSTLWWGDNMSFNKDWWNAPYKMKKW